jgi:hypothetical protein
MADITAISHTIHIVASLSLIAIGGKSLLLQSRNILMRLREGKIMRLQSLAYTLYSSVAEPHQFYVAPEKNF